MMKTRIISAVIAASMFAVIILLGRQVYGILMMLLAFVAINELYSAFAKRGVKPIRIFSVIGVLPLLLLAFARNDAISKLLLSREIVLYGGASIYLFFVLIFAMVVLRHKKYELKDAAVTFLGGLVIPYFFSFLINITYLGDDRSQGVRFLILLLLGAWGTDTFAYFSGYFFGKRKLCPDISPKKTVEGSIGGVIGSMLLMGIYGRFVLGFKDREDFIFFLVLGLLCSLLSQIGDLLASVIKRYCGIKDYGNIMPGHGGVLDRFDSVLIIAPLVYYYFRFFIV